MITHFSEVEFHTVSCIGVVQVYHELLGMPLVYRDDDRVTLDLCPHTRIHFVRKQQSHNPFHIAFAVAADEYTAAKTFVAGKLPTCGEIDEENEYRHYFRDGDGNILELYSRPPLKENAIAPYSPLGVMYLKEVGFVPHDFSSFYDWCRDVLGMKSDYPREGPFALLRSGLADIVMTNKNRAWIPIDMAPLPPDMVVTFGTTDSSMPTRLQTEHEFQIDPSTPDTVQTEFQGYRIRVRRTPDFD